MGCGKKKFRNIPLVNNPVYFTFQCTRENKSIPIQKITNETKIKIENMTAFECTIKLWCNFTGKVQLIDNIFVAPFGLSETPKTNQRKTSNLVYDKFNVSSSELTTTFANYKTTVTPENTDGPRYLTSEITMNPTKLKTENGIRHTTLRTKSESNTNVTDKTNDIVHKVEDDLTNNSALIVIVLSVLILCLLVTLVSTFYYFKRYRQKNSNDNNIDSTEKIMLMLVPSIENEGIVANIKIEFLESYLKKTMVSGRNIEDQFYVSGAPT
jgi:hypothetical protein